MPRPSSQTNGGPQQTYLSTAVALIDRIADYHTRQNAYNSVRSFCYNRPALASFITIQLLFSALPVFFFLSFAGFCIGTAACFAAFWIGVGAIILASTVSLLSFVALSAWVYLACCFYIIRQLAIYTGYLSPSSPSSTTPLSLLTTSTDTTSNKTGAGAAPPTPKKSSTQVKLKPSTPSSTESDTNTLDETIPSFNATSGGKVNGNTSTSSGLSTLNVNSGNSADEDDNTHPARYSSGNVINESEKTPMIPSYA